MSVRFKHAHARDGARPHGSRPPGTWGAALVLYVMMVAHSVLETARDAVFLARLEAGDLAIAYAAMAGVALVALAAQRHILKGLDPRRMLVTTLMVAAAVTAGMAGIVSARDDVVFIFYIWTGLVATLAVPTYWLMIGQSFTVTEAKTSFALVGVGAALGAATGSAMAAAMAQVLPARRLIALGAGLLVVAAVVTWFLAPKPKRVDPRSTRRQTAVIKSGERAEGRLRLLGEREPPPEPEVRRYLRALALLGMTSTIALTLGDLAFKMVAQQTYAKEELATFFGSFYAILNVIGVLVQLFVAPWVVKSAGMSVALLVLPLIMALGSSGYALTGAFVALLVLKVADGGLRHSLHRTTQELLFLPLTTAVRERFKAGIDVVSQRGGQAAAAAIAFIVATFAGPRMLAALACVATVGWWTVAMFVRGAYFERFRDRLHHGQLIRTASLPRLDLKALEAVLEALGSLDEQRAIAALDLLEEHGRTRLVPALVLYHPSVPVVQRALEILDPEARPDVRQVIERLVSHADPRIRAAALASVGNARAREVHAALMDSSPLVRATAAVTLGVGAEVEAPAARALRDLVEGDSVGRAALAHAIGHARKPETTSVLLELLDDRAPEVVRECAHAVERMPDAVFAPALIGHLANRDVRSEVRRALIAIGPPALDALLAALDSPRTPDETRRHIPRTLARMPNERSVHALVIRLEGERDGVTAYKMLRALGRMRHDHNELTVEREPLVRYATRHAHSALRYAGWSAAIRRRFGAAEAMPEGAILLDELVDERRRAAIERVLRAFGVLEPDVDYEQISLGLFEGDAVQLEASRELVEHHLPQNVADPVLAAVASLSSQLGDGEGARYEQIVGEMLHDDSETLRCIAAYHAAEIVGSPGTELEFAL